MYRGKCRLRNIGRQKRKTGGRKHGREAEKGNWIKNGREEGELPGPTHLPQWHIVIIGHSEYHNFTTITEASSK